MSLLREIILKNIRIRKKHCESNIMYCIFQISFAKKKYSYLSLFQKIFDETTCIIIILF